MEQRTINIKPWTGRNQSTRLSEAERFWEKVAVAGIDDCWNWIAAKNKSGYGIFNSRGSSQLSNRVAWRLVHGPIPDGLCVCHRCDNPACCNPRHFFLGTRIDNNRDRSNKNRTGSAYGEAQWKSKLTTEKVREIRALYAGGGYSQHQLARKFGVSRTLIQLIVQVRIWKHIR